MQYFCPALRCAFAPGQARLCPAPAPRARMTLQRFPTARRLSGGPEDLRQGAQITTPGCPAGAAAPCKSFQTSCQLSPPPFLPVLCRRNSLASASQPGVSLLPEKLPLPLPRLCASRSPGPAPAVGRASCGRAPAAVLTPRNSLPPHRRRPPLAGSEGVRGVLLLFLNFELVLPRERGGAGAVRARSLRPAAGRGRVGPARPGPARLPEACTASADE